MQGEAAPFEEMVLYKLKDNEPIMLSDPEICTVSDWMQKTVGRKYSTAKFILGKEQGIYEKISRESPE